MNPWLLVGIGVVYLVVAVNFARERRVGMALTFLAYAVANAGLAWDAWR